MAAAGDDVFVKQLLERVQRNRELVETQRSGFSSTYELIGNGEVLPFYRATGAFVYKKPGRMRVEIHQLEDAGGTTESQTVSGNEVEVCLYRNDVQEGFEMVSGHTTMPPSPIHDEIRWYFNRTTGLRKAYKFHVVTLVSRFTRNGTEFAVVRFVPKSNAGKNAITAKVLTLTFDLQRYVVVKSEELVTDENLKGVVSADLPEVALYEYAKVDDIYVLSRRESIWDDNYTYGSDGSDPVVFTVPLFQRHVVEEYTNTRLNLPVSDQEFQAR